MKWLRADIALLFSVANAYNPLSSPQDPPYQEAITLEPSGIDVTKWNWSVGHSEGIFQMADILVDGIRWDRDIC